MFSFISREVKIGPTVVVCRESEEANFMSFFLTAYGSTSWRSTLTSKWTKCTQERLAALRVLRSKSRKFSVHHQDSFIKCCVFSLRSHFIYIWHLIASHWLLCKMRHCSIFNQTLFLCGIIYFLLYSFQSLLINHLFYRPFDSKNPFLAPVTVNRKLNEAGDRHLMHLELDITGSKIRWDWLNSQNVNSSVD